LKCDGTRAETRFRLSVEQTSPFKSAGASVQSTTVSRDVRISGSNAEYTNFRGCAKGSGYPLHSLVSPSLPLPCAIVCHHISTGLYIELTYILRTTEDTSSTFIFKYSMRYAVDGTGYGHTKNESARNSNRQLSDKIAIYKFH